MDAKITLSFDEDVIEKAKRFADRQNISLSRLTEMLYRKITSSNYATLEDLPISSWVNEIAAGEAEYKTKQRSKKSMKKEYYKSRR
jgi:hypothetical protein